MKKVVLWSAAGLFVLLVVLVVAVKLAAGARLDATYETHAHAVPLPYPEEGSAAAAGDEAALARAVDRGRHLVHARYGCTHCHGEDLGGGLMTDDPLVGRWPGPNLTRGKGSVVANYEMEDWDRIVRHGVKPDGRPALMPSQDFAEMSDQELSDIVAYISSLPPVDRNLGRPSFGPLGTVLLAVKALPLSAETLAARTEHPARPPSEADPVAFGAHLAKTCVGCHGEHLAGGPIPGAPPEWPAAANLTPHADGLAGWDFARFERALRRGERADGTPLRTPMREVANLGKNMTDTELRALWAYLRSLPAVPSAR
ncbi:MAG: cytochrome C [Deltaproteobacteria bacterium]|nr:MAG: cytochrome C [Deltaproteobacteria bacterium]